MDVRPTYHLPPNFSTPPPPTGPFRLGTVLRDFERKEQMRPLNHEEAQQVSITKTFPDQKGGFAATRDKLKSGEFGIWAKFLGLEGVGADASVSATRSETDVYIFDSVDTDFFYPSPTYISDCLKLPDVADYLQGTRYKKPVYLVTGIKVGKGVSVRMENKKEIKGTVELGVNNSGGANVQLGPKGTGAIEDNPAYVFTESSDIVVGIQCLKIYHEKAGMFFGKLEVKSEYVTSGATFHGRDGSVPEDKPVGFVAVQPEDYKGMVTCVDHN